MVVRFLVASCTSMKGKETCPTCEGRSSRSIRTVQCCLLEDLETPCSFHPGVLRTYDLTSPRATGSTTWWDSQRTVFNCAGPCSPSRQLSNVRCRFSCDVILCCCMFLLGKMLLALKKTCECSGAIYINHI